MSGIATGWRRATAFDEAALRDYRLVLHQSIALGYEKRDRFGKCRCNRLINGR